MAVLGMERRSHRNDEPCHHHAGRQQVHHCHLHTDFLHTHYCDGWFGQHYCRSARKLAACGYEHHAHCSPCTRMAILGMERRPHRNDEPCHHHAGRQQVHHCHLHGKSSGDHHSAALADRRGRLGRKLYRDRQRCGSVHIPVAEERLGHLRGQRSNLVSNRRSGQRCWWLHRGDNQRRRLNRQRFCHADRHRCPGGYYAARQPDCNRWSQCELHRSGHRNSAVELPVEEKRRCHRRRNRRHACTLECPARGRRELRGHHQQFCWNHPKRTGNAERD